MTNFLLKLFVPDYPEKENPRVRSAVGAFSGGVGICANLLLFGSKLLAGLLTGSVSIMADAMNNLSDASGSILTLVGFRLAGKPADAHHPYGHARFEYLSGLAVVVLILLMGYELVKSSVQKILHPVALTFSGVAVLILVLSIGVKFFMYRLNTKLGRHIGSAALLAVATDSRNDCIATAAVLAATLTEQMTDLRVDGWMGLAVAAFILKSGWDMAKDTVNPLLGEGADPQLRQKIADYIRTKPYVLGYHDLMVHDYGPGRQYASLHVEMDYREDSLVCHERIDDMEYECRQNYGIRLVIHYDPVVTDDPEQNRLRECCAMLLRNRDPRLSLHDFRMVPGRVHMNLVFDVELPWDLRGREEAIRLEIEEFLNRETNRAYHVRITFDTAQTM